MRKFFACVVLAAAVCAAKGVYGQGARMEAPPVRLSALDTAHVTCDALLKNTKLETSDKRWTVTSYNISYTLPDGKTYGPYQREGAALTDADLKMIKRLKGKNAVIDIAQISLVGEGKQKFTYPISLRYDQ